MDTAGAGLGRIVFSRRRGGRFGAFVCVALAVICGFLPAALALSGSRPGADGRGTAAAFVATGVVLLLLGWRLATTGLWFHERGVRRRGVLSSWRHAYSAITGVEIEEFRTLVNGADAGHSVIIRYLAAGRRYRIALAEGNDRDPDADAIIALMRGGPPAAATSPAAGPGRL